ncbi:hypothetical protein DPMN_116508 [Dreissena polymorpha]|uniref:Uncharacterized protein n=1 Tax=Dreissena polymorpha TaxID=45954 RepID=A0A9D4QUC8_DREPO|nr:hypothetical protein DPMN_116508 [Dreissena polymorpha]
MNNRAILEGATSLTPPSIAFSNAILSLDKCEHSSLNKLMILYADRPTQCLDQHSDSTNTVTRPTKCLDQHIVSDLHIPPHKLC